MNNPLEAVVSYFISRIDRLKIAGEELFINICAKFSNFVFNGSKRTDIVILLFNAIAILSSHTAQIHGLENSTRENKDFLIELEEKERKIDLGLTLIPPLIMNYMLSHKLERGEINTRYEKNLIGKINLDAGKDSQACYSPITHKENFLNTSSEGKKFNMECFKRLGRFGILL